MGNIWFQRHGATSHIDNEIINLLKNTFGVASKTVRFNTAGLFYVVLCEVACLRGWKSLIADKRPQLLQKAWHLSWNFFEPVAAVRFPESILTHNRKPKSSQ